MIKCPKCKRAKHLILEQPHWINESKFKYIISISCYCTNCDIEFTVNSELISVTDAYDIEKKDGYY